MPEREQQILEWRRNLENAIGPDPAVLDELESHLRDEIDNLVRQGRSADDAFQAAILQLGTPAELKVEFGKVARPWWPVRLVLAGTFLAIGGFLVLIGSTGVGAAGDGLLLTHVVAVTIGYLLTYGLGSLALCYALRRMVQDLPAGQLASWTRALTGLTISAFALTLIGVVLGGIWANSQWGSVWSWDAREIGALLTLIWQALLVISVRCWAHQLRWLLCWGILGNVIVTYAWFVTSILSMEGQLHSYGTNRGLVLMIFYVILVTHFLCMAGGLAPSGWLRLRKTTT